MNGEERHRFLSYRALQKQQPNLSPEQLQELLPSEIRLDQHTCICFGKRNGVPTYDEFIICRASKTPLVGPHEILYKGQIYRVNSLNHFKINILEFKGLVSFERSVFILFGTRLVRLSFLRDRLQILLFNNTLSTPTNVCESSEIRKPVADPSQIRADLIQYIEQISEACKQTPEIPFQQYIELVMTRISELVFEEEIDELFQYVNFFERTI